MASHEEEGGLSRGGGWPLKKGRVASQEADCICTSGLWCEGVADWCEGVADVFVFLWQMWTRHYFVLTSDKLIFTEEQDKEEEQEKEEEPEVLGHVIVT